MKLKSLLAATAALILGASVTLAGAQAYPTKPVTIVVPFAAGGPTDTVTRLVAQNMAKTLGQTVLVENVGGAGGNLGNEKVAKAAPDGYTLLLMHIGISTSATLYRNLRYNAMTDLEPIGLVTTVPMTMIANKNFPPNNMKELVAYVKANKDKVSYANAGIGAASHLCGMLFMSTIQTDLLTVPYKGTGPAKTDLLGGQVNFMCDQTTNTTSEIKAGTVKAYGITSKARVASLPDLPTMAESGFKDFDVGIWHGMWAPKGTPKPVIDKLVAALNTALNDADITKKFGDLGTAPEPADRRGPEVLRAHLKAEIEKWGPIIKKAGIYAD
jgi:tripartite-type tricarboxylate transporter receptor subunit TctC